MVDFNKETFSVLRDSKEEECTLGENYPFPDWDILKEIDRKAKRYAMMAKRRLKTLKYIKDNPSRIEELKKKHGL